MSEKEDIKYDEIKSVIIVDHYGTDYYAPKSLEIADLFIQLCKDVEWRNNIWKAIKETGGYYNLIYGDVNKLVNIERIYLCYPRVEFLKRYDIRPEDYIVRDPEGSIKMAYSSEVLSPAKPCEYLIHTMVFETVEGKCLKVHIMGTLRNLEEYPCDYNVVVFEFSEGDKIISAEFISANKDGSMGIRYNDFSLERVVVDLGYNPGVLKWVWKDEIFKKVYDAVGEESLRKVLCEIRDILECPINVETIIRDIK